MNQSSDPPVAVFLDGEGGAREEPYSPEKMGNSMDTGTGELPWIHLNWDDAESLHTLTEDFAVDPIIAEALLVPESRPRSHEVGSEALIILRGVNLAAGSAPEDMVSIRILAGRDRILTLSRRQLKSLNDMRTALSKGAGPVRTGEFVAGLVEALVERIGPVVEQLGDEIDIVEDQSIDGGGKDAEASLAAIRRRVIQLYRFMSPQRDALARLATDKHDWLMENDRARLREAGNQLTRQIEDLVAFRERGQVIQEEIALRVNRQLNRNAYLLTIGGGILLPLNLVAGMLGMNVGGIPGKDWPWAFALISAVFLLFAGSAIILARRRGWM